MKTISDSLAANLLKTDAVGAPRLKRARSESNSLERAASTRVSLPRGRAGVPGWRDSRPQTSAERAPSREARRTRCQASRREPLLETQPSS